MPVKTIYWEKGKIKLIDQTLLPCECKYLEIDNIEDLWEAIKKLRVRGAPAIGIAVALGIALVANNSRAKDSQKLLSEIKDASKYLATSRPTAVNLFWALERMQNLAQKNIDKPVKELRSILVNEAIQMIEEDNRVCKAMGEYGAKLLPKNATVLTHCNAGGLATASYGTALAVIYVAAEQGKNIKVFANETRPLLQGARLTVWELMQSNIDVTLICDNMAAVVMKEKKINGVFVGADRIAANGDTANKIGTYGLSILAKFHKIPFYVVAPLSTIDISIPDGSHIPIEEREKDEIIHGFGRQTAPIEVNCFNPAFDVTPNKNITAIITELGIVETPYKQNIEKLFGRKFK